MYGGFVVVGGFVFCWVFGEFCLCQLFGVFCWLDCLQFGLIVMNFQVWEGVLLNCYYDLYFVCDVVKLLFGEYFVSGEDLVIVIVFGFCVLVCLCDLFNGIVGMNYFMFFECGFGGDLVLLLVCYGSYVMELLINCMLVFGVSCECLQVKVFGGGLVLCQISVVIGQCNVEFIFDYLVIECILLFVSDVLEVFLCKIYFFLCNGWVLVKFLVELKNDIVLQCECDYCCCIDCNVDGGFIDLF